MKDTLRALLKAGKQFGEGFLLTYRQIKRGDKNILNFVVYGLLYDIFINLYKPFSAKFVTRLGGGEWHIALLNSLPGIIAVFALIPGSLIINRFKSKKGVISVFFTISRVFVLAIAFVTFLPEGMRAMTYVLLLSFMNFPDAISQTGLQGFLGDVFDGHNRSRAITLRNKFGQIVAPVIAITTGLIVTLVPRGSAQQINSQAILIYQVFFVLSFCVGITEVIIFRRFKERQSVQEVKEKKGGSLAAIPATLKDKKFVAYMIPTIIFYFTYQSGWPLFGIIQVIDLGANELHMAINVAVSGLFGFLAAGFWSKLIAKKGNDYTTAIAAMAISISALTTALSPNIYVYIALQALGGASGIGIVITLLNGLLAATPEKNRVIYISVYNTFVNISLGLSPLFAAKVQELIGTRYAMLVIGIMRLLAGLLLYWIYLKHKKRNALSAAP